MIVEYLRTRPEKFFKGAAVPIAATPAAEASDPAHGVWGFNRSAEVS